MGSANLNSDRMGQKDDTPARLMNSMIRAADE